MTQGTNPHLSSEVKYRGVTLEKGSTLKTQLDRVNNKDYRTSGTAGSRSKDLACILHTIVRDYILPLHVL